MDIQKKNPAINSEGFTLTEVAVVLIVVGILSVAFVGNYMSMRSTRNMNSDGRALLSLIQRAKVEAIGRGECVGLILNTGNAPPADLSGQSAANRGNFFMFLDDGNGVGGTACNAIQDGAEVAITVQQNVGDGVAMTPTGFAVPVNDPNSNDLFDRISFAPRALVAARGSTAGQAVVFRNDPNPASATWWGRVIINPSGSAAYQTNDSNTQADVVNWSR